MDKIKQTLGIIKSLNQLEKGYIKDYEFIDKVCLFFDEIKEEKISEADLQFLLYIANKSWIPHYFDFLNNFQNPEALKINNINLLSFSSFVNDSSLYINESKKLHKFQREILNLFSLTQNNRYFLSASTSFWKTFLIYEIIRKMKYKNIVLIFPTIALLGENYEKIIWDKDYEHIKQMYKIHTLSDIKEEDLWEYNIFIFTPERYLSFLDQPLWKIQIDFFLVDEAYKLDNEYLDDNESKENERDTAYRLAIYRLLNNNPNIDLIMAWPYISFDEQERNSFYEFIRKKQIKILDYNKYNIVQKNIKICNNRFTKEDEELWPKKNNKIQRRYWPTLEIISELNDKDWTICFCPNKSDVENLVKYSVSFPKIQVTCKENTQEFQEFQEFIEHLKKNYIYKDKERIIIKWLENGICGHHGLIPKYIQKEIINYFNKWFIKILFCTTTITEGVNTSAKNIVIYKAKKWDKPLKSFDAKNIEGRAWRFWYHYTWNIYIMDEEFNNAKQSLDEIKHKNYDKMSTKDNIDLFITDNDYLDKTSIKTREDIEKEFLKRNINLEIINIYKWIDPLIKIKIFDLISSLHKTSIQSIKLWFKNFNNLYLDHTFLKILNILKEVVPSWLWFYFNRTNWKEQPIIYWMIIAYLNSWIQWSIHYYVDNINPDINIAIRNTSKFIYNILKYQFVKYLWAFNLMRKIYLSQVEWTKFEDITWLERLLRKLEYNAISDKARKASDYWCPQKIIDYYDAPNFIKKRKIQNSFDWYEKSVFKRVNPLI